MFNFRWFGNLRFSYKLTVLLVPCFVSFLGLGGWNSYANRVAGETRQKVDTAYQVRGEVMTSALVALHYSEAVENQIPDTIRIKHDELKVIQQNLANHKEWILGQAIEPLDKNYAELLQQVNRILEMAPKPGEGAPDEAALLGDISTAFNKLLSEHINNLTLHDDLTRRNLDLLNLLVMGLGILLLCGVLVITVRVVINPMNAMLGHVRAIASGDLSQRIEVASRDEMGQLLLALKDMTESLTNICTKVRTNSDSITSTSHQIASGNIDLSQRTEEQAASLEETAASMKQFVVSVHQNVENAKQANQLAINASEIAVKGGSAVGEVVETMSSINSSSRKIKDIIGVIEGIAFQTNILALNAAVEAARAGEQGRGFAVVAGEVRNLAQRSAAAAKEITSLIVDSVDKVETGTRQVDQAGATMAEIVAAVKRVTDIMAEISAASIEQRTGIDQVDHALAQMDAVTQQNATLVEQAAAAAETLNEQADALIGAVSVFKLEAGQTSTKATPGDLVAESARARPASTVALPVKRVRRQKRIEENKDDWKEF